MNTRELVNIYDLGDVYQAIYHGRGKDYRAESAVVTKHVRKHNATARTLLDVGCGTGSHLQHFAEEFPHVEGIDLTDGMLTLARQNLPHVPLHQGDMRSFRLDRTFDVITSMFSAVGNLGSADELDTALRCFARHLTPGGVIVIEPWWFPENFIDDYVGGDVVTVDGRTISRVSHSVRLGAASRMEVHYVVAEPGTGIRHFADTHVMSLISRSRYEAAFEQAGCTVEYISGEYDGNGLFVGVKTTD
ncbi:class I SAM-dependent methyltransferase [Streptomyces sp. NPDC002845]